MRENLPEWLLHAKSQLGTTLEITREGAREVSQEAVEMGREIAKEAVATTRMTAKEAVATTRMVAKEALSATRHALEALEARLDLKEEAEASPPPSAGETHLDLARESLRDLVNDARVPQGVRDSLAEDYRQVQAMLDKIEHGHVHIAVFGRVSVGKSALLNALLGENRFRTSPLHGETRIQEIAAWEEVRSGGVFLIDTPGINEVDGESRERLAHEVVGRADLVLFVVDGDITETELTALRVLATQARPLILVLNKSDRYTVAERELLMTTLAERTHNLVRPEYLVCSSAAPAERIYVQIDEYGRETEIRRRPTPDLGILRERLWALLEAEGKTLAALNAGLFASRLSDQVATRILEAKRGLAEKVVRTYCISKGVAVAVNPIPVVDLFAAVMVDVSMILHLSQLYGFPVTKGEASGLIKTIAGQTALLMGTVWTVNLISAALKVTTGGFSTVFTAATQGAVAYYATYVIGQAAERFFAQGRSWGDGGPKQVVQEILESLDRDSLLTQARADILERLKMT
ncbi:G domain-containing protein [Gammaproteobacteria bacterium]